MDDICIDAMRRPREGAQFESVVHYGYFLNVKGFTVLIPGDCALAASGRVRELIPGPHVDLALLNLPWVLIGGMEWPTASEGLERLYKGNESVLINDGKRGEMPTLPIISFLTNRCKPFTSDSRVLPQDRLGVAAGGGDGLLFVCQETVHRRLSIDLAHKVVITFCKILDKSNKLS